MAHKHLPKGHPGYEAAPTCKRPKDECDRLWTEYLHNHVGERCRKRVEPKNKLETCYIRRQVKAGDMQATLASLRSRVGSVVKQNSHGTEPTDAEPWPHGSCEFDFCGKRGRWMVRGQVRCGGHLRD
jgi:hypothetical protein